MSELSTRLKKLRIEKQLSREELANALQISYWAIAKYETGERNPDNATLARLADFFGVSVDYLLGRTDEPHAANSANADAVRQIDEALADDPELLAFWLETKKRPDLQLFLKQVKSASPRAIRQMIAIVKAIEEEEDREDS